MRSNQSVAEVIYRLGESPNFKPRQFSPIPSPDYTPDLTRTEKIFLGVRSLENHMTDEGHQLQQGLSAAGYKLCGHDLPINSTDCLYLLKKFHPAALIVQDKREWDQQTLSSRHDNRARFINTAGLRLTRSVFKMTVLKDAHQKPQYHQDSAYEIGTHGWIVYYHPSIVHYLAQYTRKQHLIRTWHSVDPKHVPDYSPERSGCILSGALSKVYPLRWRLLSDMSHLPECVMQSHPGYHCRGTTTPDYLKTLSRYKVSICTSSVYGYALRKVIEATACGCRVLTDLPIDDVLPEIDDNLYRIHPDTPTPMIATILKDMLATYKPERQAHYAEQAKGFYDYRNLGRQLASDINMTRKNYNG